MNKGISPLTTSILYLILILVSKEVIIFNEEVLVLLIFLTFVILLVQNLTPAVNESLTDKTYEPFIKSSGLGLFLFSVVENDAPLPYHFGFQEPASTTMEQITSLHNTLLFYLTVVLIVVSYMLFKTIYHFNAKKHTDKISYSRVSHASTLEIIWTITPGIILVLIAVPSFMLLYLMDEVIDSQITVKSIGHQWYWSYELSDYENEDQEFCSFDSYIVPTDELEKGALRLLEVDNSLILPTNVKTRVLVTSSDVLHSWAVPSLGVKVDAVPGRLNQLSLEIKREGTYYGQCSEICGVNHGFMPIVIEACSISNYLKYF